MSKKNRNRNRQSRPEEPAAETPVEREDARPDAADGGDLDERVALRDELIGKPGDGMENDLPPPETQRERWLKYGSNVALVTIIVMVLAVAVTWLSQQSWARTQVDTTQAKVYSLKPQTLNVIRNLNQKVTLVSLYSERAAQDSVDVTAEQRPKMDYAGRVRDLLEEYARNSKNVEVQIIDPVANPGKVDDLIADVTNRYGGEVKKYQEFLGRWPKVIKPIKEAALRENAEVSQLENVLESSGGGSVALAVQSVSKLAESLESMQSRIDQRLKQRPPDYKGATDAIRDRLEPMSGLVGQIVAAFERVPGVAPATQPTTNPTNPAGPTTGPSTAPTTAPSETSAQAEDSRNDPKLPPALMAYLHESLPRYKELKRQMDDVLKQASNLGELKLDELRQKLRERDAILVLGPNEMRSLSFEQVWQLDPDVKQMLRTADVDQLKPKFAGEQQITTAIWSLTQPGARPKIVFVRPGGPPLTAAGSPFQRAGPLAVIAQRLRDYNFDVAEKDLSGQWAMQSRSMGAMMPPEPEPSDEEMKSAVWVVVDGQSQAGPMGGGADIAGRLAMHLDAGGSAMVLGNTRAPDLASALGKWGIALRTDAVAVHEPIKTAAQSEDFVEEAQKLPFIFVLNQYSNHLITRPMRSLDTAVIASSVIQTPGAAGATVAPLMTTPSGMKTWGETELEKALDERTATYDPKTDIAEGPIVLGAASERKEANWQTPGRLVVFGGLDWVASGLLRLPDPELLRKGVVAARFPGNQELFTNSIFWLSKMDTMIAISPSAMEVSRIQDMGKGAEGFWRIGVVLIGLPLAVVVAGTLVYIGRRD